MAQSKVGQINEGELSNDNPWPRTVQGPDLLRLLGQFYSEFKREDRYPQEKMKNLACPVYKLRPDLYRSNKRSSCQGYGFKDIGTLNEHIKRCHKPTEREEKPRKKDAAKSDLLRLLDNDVYRKWDEAPPKRIGVKRTEDHNRETWWNICVALKLVDSKPDPLPENYHLAFPGPEWNEFLLFLESLPERGWALMAIVLSSNAASLPELPDDFRDEISDSTGIAPPGRRTAAEELNPRPDDGTKYSPGVGQFDSAYHSNDVDGDFVGGGNPPVGPLPNQSTVNLEWLEDLNSTMVGVGGDGMMQDSDWEMDISIADLDAILEEGDNSGQS